LGIVTAGQKVFTILGKVQYSYVSSGRSVTVVTGYSLDGKIIGI
jgi:hypothetical protein